MARVEIGPETNGRPSKIGSVLIVRLGAIGDVLHTVPAFAELRQIFPQARIAWAVEKGGAAQILRMLRGLDELIEIDLRSLRRGMMQPEGRVEIRRNVTRLAGYELAIDFQGLLKSSALPWIARIPRRIGFDFPALREPASGLLLTERVPADDTVHIIEKNLSVIRHLGDGTIRDPVAYDFPLEPGAEAEAFAEETVLRAGANFALLNPGGGWATKLWGPEKYGLLADRLHEEFGLISFITYGPGEKQMAERAAAAAVSRAARPLQSTLAQFAAIARRAEIFVGGDTGPMHLAAAMRTPIVAIFGPTSSRRNGPFDARDVVVERRDLECRVECYRRKCDHCSCLQLDVDQVWEGIKSRLNQSLRD